MPDRRTFQRITCPIPLNVSGERWQLQGALMKDIGAGGICFRSGEFLAVGSRLKIEFIMPPLNVTLLTIGKVVWNREVPHINRYEVGVEFIDISGQDQERIQQFVKKNLHLQFTD